MHVDRGSRVDGAVDERVRRADCGAGRVKSCLAPHGNADAKPTI